MRLRDATGAIGDIAGIATTGLRAVRTRLELIAIELKDEKAWVVRFLVVAVAALYLFTFGTLLAILAVSLAMPETSRPALLGGVGGLFIAAGVAAVLWMRAQSKRRHPLFQDTLEVLRKDEQALGKDTALLKGATGD